MINQSKSKSTNHNKSINQLSTCNLYFSSTNSTPRTGWPISQTRRILNFNELQLQIQLQLPPTQLQNQIQLKTPTKSTSTSTSTNSTSTSTNLQSHFTPLADLNRGLGRWRHAARPAWRDRLEPGVAVSPRDLPAPAWRGGEATRGLPWWWITGAAGESDSYCWICYLMIAIFKSWCFC